MKKKQFIASILIAMRITIAPVVITMIFTCSLYANHSLGQEILNKRVTVSVDKIELNKIFHLIQAQTEAKFIYSPNLIKSERKVTIKVVNEKLADFLKEMFRPLNIGYNVIDDKIILYSTEQNDPQNTGEKEYDYSANITADKIKVTGTVLNDKGEPLQGVSIVIKGKSSGTTTDGSGNFSLEVDKADNTILTFSYTGFNQKEVILGQNISLVVRLVPQNKEMNDVVVIGYGTRKRADLTTSISNIDADQIEKSVAMTPQLAMQGTMSGVQVISPGGSPFNRPIVRIRGQSTFGLGIADPLYVVDGIPLYEGNSGYDGTPGSRNSDLRGNVNVISMFNPGDIESISVLKDAAATAVYGARAGNGVILITTKKGKRGTPKVEFNGQLGVQNAIKTYSVLNSLQYAKLAQDALANSGVSDAIDPYFNVDSPQYVGNKTNYDWQKPLLKQNALVQDYSVRVSGASDATNYYFSGGYANTNGTIVNQNQERYSFAMNINARVNKYINVGMLYRGVTQNAQDNAQTDIGYASRIVPWQPIYDPNGPFGFAKSTSQAFVPNPMFGTPSNSIQPKYNLGTTTLLYGPKPANNYLALEALNNIQYNLNMNMGNAFVELMPLTGLKIKGSLGVDYIVNHRNEFADFNDYQFIQTPQNPYTAQDGTSTGNIRIVSQTTLNTIKDLSVQYVKAFKEHNFDLLFDASQQEITYNYSNQQVYQIQSRDPKRRFIFPSNTDPRSMQAEMGREDNAIIGYLGRLSYHYSNKYYADFTIRRDGSSRFADGQKWGTFPVGSAAWRISSESFFKDIRFVNDLKIRGSYGTVGNQESRSSYPYLSTVSNYPWYSFGSGDGNGTGALATTAVLNDFPNKGLTWEKNTTTDVGLDAVLFNNHFNITFDYYNKVTSGILQYTTLPLSVGSVNQALTNIANVRNSGIELSLGYSDNIGEFNYNISGNITTVKNTALKVYNPTTGAGTNNIDTGKSLNFINGPEIAGIFQNQKEIDDYKSKVTYDEGFQSQKYHPGDLYFKDLNGDGRIDNKDYTQIGKTIPGYYYGITLGGNYKGFDIYILLQGVGNVQTYNFERSMGENLYADGSNAWTTVLNRWTPTNTNTLIPEATRGDNANSNARFSNRFVEDGSYFRLKNVQLGYTLPHSLFKNNMKGTNIRVFVSGTNLAVITHYTGMDPEEFVYEGTGVNPPARTFTFGINATF